MVKSFLPVSVFILIFLSNYLPSNPAYDTSGLLNKLHFLLGADRLFNLSKTDTSEIPEEIKFPSTVGEVQFPHLMHIEDLETECVECHHQISAKILVTPHADYFKSSWIKCEICHKESGQIKQEIFTCSECHHSSPSSIADETLSSKVVIHKNCWTCHEVGTGSEASEICGDCHSGEKKES